MNDDIIKQNYYNLATQVIYNCFTDIGKAAHLILAGNKKDKEYHKKWIKAKRNIKYTRMKFGQFSSLIDLWADCAGIDEGTVRTKIIEFSICYPNVKCLK